MSLVGRILFALPLAAFGLLHFVGAQMMFVFQLYKLKK